MKTSVKYSILIPTFNKAEYLKYTIQSVLNSNYKNFEVIISDDFSTDTTNNLITNLNDDRVRLIKPPFKLKHVKNYEFLLKHANGEWITILGDDDGLLPNFFEKIDYELIKFPNVEVISTKPAFYYWHGVEDKYGDRVCDYQNFFEKSKIINSKLTLFLCLAGLFTRTNVPMLYTTGLVKKSLIKKIKQKSNNFFFHGVLPDYYSSVAILSYTNNFLRISEPLFWVGSSSKSVGRGIKTYESEYNHEKQLDFINPKLSFNKNISAPIHQIGLSPIYFYEALLNIPFLNKFWSGTMIKYFALSATNYEYFKIIRNKLDFRFKIPITNKDFKFLINQEIKKNGLSNSIFSLTKFLIYILNFIFNIYKSLKKVFLYIKKKLSKNHKILVSKDRTKFKNFIFCNDYIEKI